MVKKSEYLDSVAEDWYEKGQRLTREGCPAEAIEAFNRAIKKNSAHAEAYFVRGACHYSLGSYRQAEDDLDTAALLGCREAQFWSKCTINSLKKSTNEEKA
jgi:tetratricopeptide (TPR) repeat protein